MKAIQQTIKHWGHVVNYAHIPRNKTEHEKMIAFIEELMEWTRHHKDARATSLLNLIARNVEAYESQQYLSKKVVASEMLKFLMEEHGLSQADLPEIGSQSLVSKILKGDRKLTLEHIQGLSKRFGVSPAAFFS